MKKSIVAFSAAALLSGLFVSSASASTYTVKKGDTLTKIAKKYDLTVNKLKELNNLKSNTIYVNQKLVTSTSKAKKETTAAKATVSIKNEKIATYKVVAGDTLTKIANKHNLTLGELKQLNNLSSTVIKVGDTLIVSSSSTETIIDLPEEKKPSANTYENGPSIDKVIAEAKKVLGTPYSWAGSTPAGFDCSGFVYYAFKQAGYSISRHSSSTYYALGKKVSSPQRGDLVFFATGSNRSVINHLGIYLGDNQFIHASSSKGVMISSVNSSYYKSRLIGYKKLDF
ncbi:C40 family peptidase [Peribacillus asahii]|uniref:C40 family peptidase n=1 Tax=Peribacillus asahii TaxID=228899 RepID=UPI002079A347|nr:C40 family peptidase [Peribacillus asahii]USK59543.1 LysM peptidoglycan-binding domain-containing protein [Peribacillus asahii]